MRLPLFSSLCSLAAVSLLAACSPQEPPAQDASAPLKDASSLVVLNTSSSVALTRGPNGEIIISDAPNASSESHSEVVIEQAWQEDQAQEEEISEEGELVEDDNGQVYRALGDGTYEPVDVVQTVESTETVETTRAVEARSGARQPPDCPPADKPAAKPSAKKAHAKPPAPAASTSAAVMIIGSESDFKARVLNASEPVIVVFEQSWCGFCKRYLPTLNAAAERSEDYRIARVDIAKLPAVARQWAKGLSGTPHNVAFHAGAPIPGLSVSGQLSEERLAAFIERGQRKAQTRSDPEPATQSPAAQEALQEPAPSRKSGPSI